MSQVVELGRRLSATWSGWCELQVIFAPQANRDLVDLWVESNHQAAFTQAFDRLVRDLEREPSAVGESRLGNRRVALSWPVGIAFQIDDVSQHVTVYQVWTFARRGS